MDEHGTFVLERFAWGGPDRLEVSGTLAGLHDSPVAAPELILHSASEIHRLPVVPEDYKGPPTVGRRWSAAFAWPTAPVPFDAAELTFDDDIMVALPPPGRNPFGPRRLEVKRRHRTPSEPPSTQPKGSSPQHKDADSRAERTQIPTELVASQDEAGGLQQAIQRAEEDLARARADLEAEKDRHGAEVERFGEGLASIRKSAEDALAVEQGVARQLSADLEETRVALEVKDATVDELRREIETATALRERSESDARAEIDALRERVATLETTGEAAERLKADLEQIRERADVAEAALQAARAVGKEARADAQRLLDRLQTISDSSPEVA
jgi:hypothetical protein